MVKAGLVKMRTSVLFAPGDQDSDPGVHSHGDRMMFSVLLLWLLALEVSLVHLLDGVVVQVQVEAWLVFQDRAGHLIKSQGWINRVVPFNCECSTTKAKGPEFKPTKANKMIFNSPINSTE